MTTPDPTKGWNPRWLNYARVHGVDPMDVRGYEFILWNSARLTEWRKLCDLPVGAPLSSEDLAAYDVWLDDWRSDDPS